MRRLGSGPAKRDPGAPRHTATLEPVCPACVRRCGAGAAPLKKEEEQEKEEEKEKEEKTVHFGRRTRRCYM